MATFVWPKRALAQTTGIFSSTTTGTINLSMDNTTVSSNTNLGINATGDVSALLGRSLITGNGTGVSNNTTSNTFYTYGDNRINLNTIADIGGATGSLNKTFLPHILPHIAAGDRANGSRHWKAAFPL